MGKDSLNDVLISTSQWDAADYARVGGFVPALGAAALDLLDPQPGEHILDVGCGDGTLTAQIVDRGASVVGIDNSVSMIGAARARGLDVRLMDAADLKFGRGFRRRFLQRHPALVLRQASRRARDLVPLKFGGRFGEIWRTRDLARYARPSI